VNVHLFVLGGKGERGGRNERERSEANCEVHKLISERKEKSEGGGKEREKGGTEEVFSDCIPLHRGEKERRGGRGEKGRRTISLNPTNLLLLKGRVVPEREKREKERKGRKGMFGLLLYGGGGEDEREWKEEKRKRKERKPRPCPCLHFFTQISSLRKGGGGRGGEGGERGKRKEGGKKKTPTALFGHLVKLILSLGNNTTCNR